MVAEHTFREDLFLPHQPDYRQAAPPCASAGEDIPPAGTPLRRPPGRGQRAAAHRLLGRCPQLPLARLPYPGNIRELKNLVERTILVNAKPVLDASDFDAQYLRPNEPDNTTAKTLPGRHDPGRDRAADHPANPGAAQSGTSAGRQHPSASAGRPCTGGWRSTASACDPLPALKQPITIKQHAHQIPFLPVGIVPHRIGGMASRYISAGRKMRTYRLTSWRGPLLSSSSTW